MRYALTMKKISNGSSKGDWYELYQHDLARPDAKHLGQR
jgi:hypothetical protein